jgi:broad specificity phosphatase PhoE
MVFQILARSAGRVAGLLIAAAALALPIPSTAAEPPAELLAALQRGGFALLVRHAQTEPGVGDPPGMRLSDCATQRNLSAAGREQARAIGAAVRSRVIPVAAVRSSQWCRCLDTARLAFGDHAPVSAWPALNSFFDDRSAEAARTRELRAALAAVPGAANVVWVTHQVNITALTGVAPAPGEIVVVRKAADGVTVAGRWMP